MLVRPAAGIDDIGDAIVDAGAAVVDGAKAAGEATVDGAKAVGNFAVNAGEAVIGGAQDLAEGAGEAVEKVEAVAGAVSGGMDFMSDPAGWMVGLFREAATGLADVVLPGLLKATHPDLSASWFIDAYQLSFSVSILVYVILLIVNLVRTASGTLSGHEMADILAIQTWYFLGGAAFGPMAGWVVVQVFGSLAEVFISWGINGSVQDALDHMTSIMNANDLSIVGGAIIVILLLGGMILALLLVVVMLIVSLVTLYFTGVLMPLALVWIIDKPNSHIAKRMLWVWLGILASHALLFLLLGLAFKMIASTTAIFATTPGLTQVATLLAAIIAIFMAALTPVVLFKLAPVMPTTAGQAGPSLKGGGGGAGGGGSQDAASPQEAAERQSASSASESAPSEAISGPGGGGPGGGGPSSAAGEAGGQQPAGPLEAAATSQQGDGASEPTPSSSSTSTPDGASAASAPSPADAAGQPGAGAASAGGGAAHGAATASEAAEVGAAESATGVGAVVGIPTLVAAGASAMAGSLGEQAQGDMGEEGQ